MFRLPVSGWEVVVRPPNGTDDLVILETEGNVVARALTLLARVARRADADAADWPALCVTDLEVLLAMLRQTVLGPAVTCAFDCPRPDCRERVEVGFSLAGYVGGGAAAAPARRHRLRSTALVLPDGRRGFVPPADGRRSIRGAGPQRRCTAAGGALPRSSRHVPVGARAR